MATAGFETTDPQEPDCVLCLLLRSSDFAEGLIVYFLLFSISIGTIILKIQPRESRKRAHKSECQTGSVVKETAVGANGGSGLIIFESLSKRMFGARATLCISRVHNKLQLIRMQQLNLVESATTVAGKQNQFVKSI
jgi:hypothetical protein